MELLEDTQYALGLLNAESGGQLNSKNSIAGAKLLYGVKRTNSNEDILQYSKIIDKNGEPMVVCMKLFSECMKYRFYHILTTDICPHCQHYRFSYKSNICQEIMTFVT
jgi:hypothetical protein